MEQHWPSWHFPHSPCLLQCLFLFLFIPLSWELSFPLFYLPLRRHAVKQWPNAITQQQMCVFIWALDQSVQI